jgi:arylsulfatase A
MKHRCIGRFVIIIKYLVKTMKVLPGALIVMILACCTQARKLPNVILIMADDMGYECLSINGAIEYSTPVVDKLSTDGIHFSNAFSQPLCTPSRVKIMTGKYNYKNYEFFGYLNPNEKTFGNLMKEAGYSTCISGKWQLNGLSFSTGRISGHEPSASLWI